MTKQQLQRATELSEQIAELKKAQTELCGTIKPKESAFIAWAKGESDSQSIGVYVDWKYIDIPLMITIARQRISEQLAAAEKEFANL